MVKICNYEYFWAVSRKQNGLCSYLDRTSNSNRNLQLQVFTIIWLFVIRPPMDPSPAISLLYFLKTENIQVKWANEWQNFAVSAVAADI